MESEHGTVPIGGLRVHPESSANNVDLSTPPKKIRSSSSHSSSSSPDSPFDDPFKDDEYETYKSNTSTTPDKYHEDTQLGSKFGEKDVSGSSVPKDDESKHELPVSTLPPLVPSDNPQLKESPPIQAMDRSGDSTYRIPSYVFARTKSTAPVDWSTASNESLFSIHMGNMSFSNDPMFWRSGELGLPSEPTTSPHIFKYTPNLPVDNKTTEAGKSSEGNVAESAVATMREVIRESAEDKSHGKSSLTPSVSCRSDASGASVKLFAFPILTGDLGRSGKRNGSLRVSPESEQSPAQTRPEPQVQPQLQPQQQEPEPKAKVEASQPFIPWTRWFSCFSCCSFRS
ncbi:uncharacterized protein LOC130750022 isoform X2 [Actinidia eriantha]|nr:uncharacterized protein LOC130750022 isoform X2 [Actinidia eriantha]XP_057459391.1 uncharacterized protein LOC130750022 isoform X2 [Actinidia eriantha]